MKRLTRKANAINSTIFICQLPKDKQDKIRKLVIDYLTNEGYNEKQISETVENAMDDRLCNLSDCIDINQFL